MSTNDIPIDQKLARLGNWCTRQMSQDEYKELERRIDGQIAEAERLIRERRNRAGRRQVDQGDVCLIVPDRREDDRRGPSRR